MQTQHQRILAILTRGETLTVRQMFENLHINCPTIRISELRRAGYGIGDKWIKTEHTRYKVYFLPQSEIQRIAALEREA